MGFPCQQIIHPNQQPPAPDITSALHPSQKKASTLASPKNQQVKQANTTPVMIRQHLQYLQRSDQ